MYAKVVHPCLAIDRGWIDPAPEEWTELQGRAPTAMQCSSAAWHISAMRRVTREEQASAGGQGTELQDGALVLQRCSQVVSACCCAGGQPMQQRGIRSA
jgi:hypothetical protein